MRISDWSSDVCSSDLQALQAVAALDATLIFFEGPQRLDASLADMADVLGARQAAVARELTKLYEEVRRGGLAELAAHYHEAGAQRGEDGRASCRERVCQAV